MKQYCNPPATGLVLEIGSGDNPNPRSNILVDRFLSDNTERGGDIIIDRPIVVADAHHLPFRDQSIAYTICSHILEHMDDPKQFVRELVRVSKGGYIASPSEIAERLFHWSFHRWYVNKVGERIVLHPRDPAEPFGELFDYLYAYNPAYHFFQRSMHDLFWVEQEWHGKLEVDVSDHSPLDLKDPATVKQLSRARLGLAGLAVLFVQTLIARALPSSFRSRIRRMLKRSYI